METGTITTEREKMPTVNHYTPEQQKIIAARLGQVFGIENTDTKILADSWGMESYAGGKVKVQIELVSIISHEHAMDILNAVPLD